MTATTTTIIRLAAVLLAGALVPAAPIRAAEPAEPAEPVEPAALDFVVPYVDKKCDDVNNSWLVTNKHTHLSIQVTVRWQPVGGMQKEETIVLSPAQRRPVGCAPTVEIVSAELMQF